jgi:hypothetical protein
MELSGAKVQSSMVLIADAPSESEAHFCSIPGKIFNSSSTMVLQMLALEVTSGLWKR